MFARDKNIDKKSSSLYLSKTSPTSHFSEIWSPPTLNIKKEKF